MIDPRAMEQILGLNERNLKWVNDLNPRWAFPQVDDKINTKEILRKADIPVPETYHILSSFLFIEETLESLTYHNEFVIKPSRGRAGGGILLLKQEDQNLWKTPSGKKYTQADIQEHLGDILFGVYSFGNQDDRVLIERKIEAHSFFTDFYSDGIADIRIIILKGNPVMAMARIPTKGSDGKANLHQGAIGLGICLETGLSTSASWKGRTITTHPDTHKNLLNHSIPFWEKILDLSQKASRLVDLGYLGVDIVLDKKRGPLILELNARPGLEIQVVNQKFLSKELERHL